MDQSFEKSPGQPHFVDVHVGAKIRQRRKALNISQGTLAEAAGLTFQQIQKYERGTNRISASKLHLISLALDMPITRFYDGLPDIVEETPVEHITANAFLKTSEGQQLAANFPKITPAMRKGVLNLIRSLVNNDD